MIAWNLSMWYADGDGMTAIWWKRWLWFLCNNDCECDGYEIMTADGISLESSHRRSSTGVFTAGYVMRTTRSVMGWLRQDKCEEAGENENTLRLLMRAEKVRIRISILNYTNSLSNFREDHYNLPVFYSYILIVRLCYDAIYFSLFIFF